ncbi:MAG: VOC family protein [Peptococcaceae bacterium]|nr:VOC family protein [Peptococcaceae bacterium]
MIKGFNHVGIAVKDLDRAVEFFEKTYNARLVERNKYLDQKIESAFMAIGEARLELTASLDPQSVIARFIEARGEGIHHISLQVDQFDEVVKGFKEKGLTVIAEGETGDFKAAFVHPKGNFGILTEIIEPKNR